ncbi:YebC/PmpR family DNA-binding transcriptional regulator [Candidatus Woesebacteria bacterium]|nr:YebC/PmpR family DNA-binding transcriptional regulator [Candidatus Woesebacteria bacterium]
MSGHSKWANIKRKKGINDAVRSNAFTKMARLITSAVSEGGGMPDPAHNFKLRLAMDRARAVNMPKDTIQRAMDKGSGANAVKMKELVYEGFGPGNSALIITALTDNPNRTVPDVKLALDRNGGKIASPNAVSYLFQHCGVLEIAHSNISEEEAFRVFDQLEGIDFEDSEESYIMYIPFENIKKVKEILGSIDPQTLDVYYLPLNPIAVDSGVMTKIEQLTEKLEDLDDVQGVYSNAIEA